MVDMRATFRGALAALAALALAGCTPTGSPAPMGAPSASPEIQELVAVMSSETRGKLVAAADRFDGDHCEVHIRRNSATPEWGACLDTRNSLASLAGRLDSELTTRRPAPAEADDLVSRTSEALRGVTATAGHGADPKQLTLSLRILRGALQEWSAYGG